MAAVFECLGNYYIEGELNQLADAVTKPTMALRNESAQRQQGNATEFMGTTPTESSKY